MWLGNIYDLSHFKHILTLQCFSKFQDFPKPVLSQQSRYHFYVGLYLPIAMFIESTSIQGLVLCSLTCFSWKWTPLEKEISELGNPTGKKKGDEAELGGKITIIFVSMVCPCRCPYRNLELLLGGGRANRVLFWGKDWCWLSWSYLSFIGSQFHLNI